MEALHFKPLNNTSKEESPPFRGRLETHFFGQIAVLNACPNPDILVNNPGCFPSGDFSDWNRKDYINSVIANTITSIEMIEATINGMIERKFGRIVNITSRTTKTIVEGLGLSGAAKIGLIAFVVDISRQSIRNNVTINNLLPGSFNTNTLESFIEKRADKIGQTKEAVKAKMITKNPAGRFCEASELGDLCTFLCSVQMGYITGQNFLIDGGTYPGIF
ncbi:MAG: SDR family oxidoreductase [Okeania sp. SIO2F4]|uniref:SDR family oxidoreductase n=1 Tax=Okeania sp. SIO2F4 TaxID=2607790 RepID=UPI001429F947|nr:SDR family oxidoreductase [Okeania sp. SIO2F4]NES03526.1 SDR family oxidoreductase [Okeania sp. SIO2F4]